MIFSFENNIIDKINQKNVTQEEEITLKNLLLKDNIKTIIFSIKRSTDKLEIDSFNFLVIFNVNFLLYEFYRFNKTFNK